MEESSNSQSPRNESNMKSTCSETLPKNYKRKNEMMLTLGKSVPLNTGEIDETPTPVRFLRNCEEVGLFQELNKNPFEETFRKAAEAVNTNNGSGIIGFGQQASGSSDDTLHTPQVFPTLPNEIIRSKTPSLEVMLSDEEDEEEEERVVRQEADTSILTSPTRTPTLSHHLIDPRPVGLVTPVHAVVPSASSSSSSSSLSFLHGHPVPAHQAEVQLCLKVSHGTTLELAGNTLKIVGTQDQQHLNKANNFILDASSNDLRTVIFSAAQQFPAGKQIVSPNVKQKLKNFLGNCKSKKSPTFNRIMPGKDESGGSFDDSGQEQGSEGLVPSAPSSIATDHRRQILREKNRAAAMRCRERRKAWVLELGRRADEMAVTNRALVHEVSALKAEVARLKALLLAHRDCPVTLAQNTAPRPTEVVTERGGNRRLSLDIESARGRGGPIGSDLPSPLVRRDEILTSVAPTTPSDLPPSLEGEERSLATPVIQLNPNARPHFR